MKGAVILIEEPVVMLVEEWVLKHVEKLGEVE